MEWIGTCDGSGNARWKCSAGHSKLGLVDRGQVDARLGSGELQWYGLDRERVGGELNRGVLHIHSALLMWRGVGAVTLNVGQNRDFVVL
jgi:hypothetical protein